MDKTFKAFIVNKKNDRFISGVDELTIQGLPEGEVLVEVHYSSVNYKDGLASVDNSTIVKNYPFVPGIDLSGVVVESKDSRYQPGDKVIATSYEIGVSHYGGYSEYARLQADWLVPLPEGISLQEAMIYGTAGFTAALSIYRLEEVGITPDAGDVLVTGATGGVGSLAVAMLAKLGYSVIASTGKSTAHPFLNKLGAKNIIGRDHVYEEKVRALDKQQWAAAVDPVGGQTLASILSKINYGGAVAVSGLTGGPKVPTTVFPFILRGVSLLGVDSVYCPMHIRKAIWTRMATDLKPDCLHEIANTITFDELKQALATILEGQSTGRMVVKIKDN